MNERNVRFTVLVCALGYFVDIYDLLLFGIVRIPSLRGLGIPEDQLLAEGVRLLNFQMTGLIVGGVLWGVLGDKRGRRSVLFGSILMYSLANILNAFVTNTDQYAWLRFIAGVGLAGELGAAVTLVSEIMSREKRGYGTAIIASVGISGAVVASLVGDYFSWQTAYLVGGGMGLALLLTRATLLESAIFDKLKASNEPRGSFLALFTDRARFAKYVGCICIGLPLWFVVGVQMTFAPELTRELGIEGVTAGRSIMWCYAGACFGDLWAGILGNRWRSRRKTVLFFLTLTAVGILVYTFAHGIPTWAFYALCAYLGIAAGYWATFMTIAAEQFGTNLRATATTTAPNIVRGAVVPMTLLFAWLKGGGMSALTSAFAVGVLSLVIAYFFLWRLEETFGKDLDYVERL